MDKNVTGIILDLRLNGGGAMFPMMLGLEQLLHDGKIGSFVTYLLASKLFMLKNVDYKISKRVLITVSNS